MSAYDVVIVGGRVAGASTALLLARAGVRVAVVERGRRGSDTVSTHGLMRAGVLQLSRWGLLDPVVAAGTPPILRTLFSFPDGEQVRVSIRRSPGVDALYAPRRTVLDRVLVDAAEEAGADFLHETVVTSLLHDTDGRVCGLSAKGAGGSSLQIEGAITVGADGIWSVVAQQVGAPVLRQGRSASAVLYRYVTDLPTEGYEWVYGDGSAAGLLPTNAGATCVFVATTPERMRHLRRSGSEHAFSTLLSASAAPELVDRVRDSSAWTSLRGWGGIPGHVRHSWGPGWALVGDAGYFKDPITTHGMTDGLRDAELLADRILEVLSGVATEAAALSAYQATRERLSSRLFAATEEVAGYDWDATRARTLLRTVSSAMSDEVDYLQALPDRHLGPGIDAFLPPDNVNRAG
ncbi:MAG: NAD(P)/FAD-dependent oxidoreductase [Marmoricola sp.]|nr:NAD(P)/FAD-dependent oxidoreductase [Marmoricola sp.]